MCLGLSPSGIPLVLSRESRQGKVAISALKELRLALWLETSGGFSYSLLQLCSYNSPLHFGTGTRLTVTGIGQGGRCKEGVRAALSFRSISSLLRCVRCSSSAEGSEELCFCASSPGFVFSRSPSRCSPRLPSSLPI